MKKYFTLIVTIYITSLFVQNHAQTLYFSATSGDWNTAATWNTASFVPIPFPPYFTVVQSPATAPPAANDFVSIVTSHTVTANADGSAATVSINSGGTIAKLLVAASVTMTIDSLIISPSGAGISQVENNGEITTHKTSLITSASGATAEFVNNGIQTNVITVFSETTGLNTLTLNGGSRFTTKGVTVTNTSPANTIIDMSSGNGVLRMVNGGFTGSGLATLNGGSAGSRIEYRGSTAQTITSSNPNFTFNEIRVFNTVGASFDADLALSNINGNIRTAGSGIINQAGFNISTPGQVNNSTNGTFNSDANLTTGTSIVNSGLINQTAGIINIGTSLTNSGTFNQTAGTVNIALNLANTGTYNAQGVIDVDQHFNNTTGSFISNGCTLNVARNWNNAGTYTYSIGDVVTLDGTAGNCNFTGTSDFYELVIDKNSRNVNVANGDIVNIRSILDVDAGTFRVTGTGAVTLLSDASGTAQLDELESGANYTGSIEVQRYLSLGNDGFRELTSPVIGSTLADWQNDGIILTGFTGADYDGSTWYSWVNTYTYNEPNASGVKVNGWVDATNNTNPTTYSNGHRVYIGTGNYTLAVQGTPVKGLQSASISNAGTSTDDQNGWNLIGNPYPCTIDWNTVAKTGTEDAIWIWNATAGNYGVYQTNAASGTNGVDNKIAHSQAFWVHGTGGSGSVIFQESNKIRNDKSFVKSSFNDEFVRIKLTSNVNTYYDEAILTFNEEATSNFDEGIDQNKLFTSLDDVAPSLAITTTDNADISIAGVNQYKSSTIAMKAFSGTNAYGTYTVDFDLPSISLLNNCVTLEDLETGTITDLKNTPNYTFSVTANSPEERFLIHITSPFETTFFAPTCATLTDGAIAIEGSNVMGNTFTLSNYNGVLQTLVGNGNQVIFEDLASGEYTVSSSQSSSCGHNSIVAFVSSPEEVIANFEIENTVIYLEENNTISPINNSNADNYNWNFGDGATSVEENPTHTYNNPGFYTITLVAEKNGCEVTEQQTIEVKAATSISEEENLDLSVISTATNIEVNFNNLLKENTTITITAMNGQVVLKTTTNNDSKRINTTDFASGIYLVSINNNTSLLSKKVLVK